MRVFRRILIWTIFICLTAGQSLAFNIFVDQSGVYHDAGIADWLRQQGNVVTTVNNFTGTGSDLYNYDIVMDFGYDKWTGLNVGKTQAYLDFIKHGGGLYLQGEKPTNSDYMTQNSNIVSFIANAGGGTIEYSTTSFLLLGNESILSTPVGTKSTQYYLDEGLAVTSAGNGFKLVKSDSYIEVGTWKRKSCDAWSSMIGFDFGDMTLAADSRLIANFDITPFSMQQFTNTNQYVFKDIVSFLGDSPAFILEPPLPVPEPSTLLYFLVVMSLFMFVRRPQFVRKKGRKHHEGAAN